jgi:hypothetical protein
MTITFANGEVFDADQPVRHRRLNPHQTRAAHDYFVSTHFESNRGLTGALCHESLPMRVDTYKGTINAW